jgi:hypothetical protein
MPGDFKEYILDKQKMKNIIWMRQELFIVKAKGGIPRSIFCEFIEFPPIIRNIMCVHQKKLTQLLTTMGKYMIFNNYYLWFLIDRCGFEIDDCSGMVTFYAKPDGIFSQFVTNFMNLRIEAMNAGNKEKEKYCR